MIEAYDANASAPITKDMDIAAYNKICRDIRNQPKWRLDADTDCDYYDGAQTSVEVNQRLKDAGIPPQDSNLIKPTINAVLGLEARSRTDYKVTSDDEAQAEIAEGLSAKIKEIETESRADRAMSDAYSSMIRAGVGWVEVSREFDPLKYPYRVREIHRNDIWWDWTAREPDLSDARYLRRDKWVDREQALRMFPEEAALIENSWSGWNTLDVYAGTDTGMARAYEVEQVWGRVQEEYLNRASGMVRLSELWYRHYEEAPVLMLPDGKAIEYSECNPYHQQAVAQGLVQVQKSLLPRVRVSIWLGPHKLMDVATPLPHGNFPYVPFWCFRKDRSRSPYGLIRDMRGPQDQIIDLDILLYEVLNSVKVEVDNDALDLAQNTYQEVAQNMNSLRSMTVLNSQRRNANGFRVTREHALATQVFQLVQERKKRIEEVGGVYRAMLGASTEASSGVAINNLVEQGSTVLAEPNDNFRYARRLVGQQLLAFAAADMVGKPMAISVREGARRKVIYINRQVMTPQGPVVENDITTAQVKVVLEDIPATPTFRAQQLQAFSQMVQAAPPQFQAIMYPAMLELSDIPNRHELAEQTRKAAGVTGPTTPEQDQQQAQMMQQQQAMQQQMIQLQMALAAANVKKTEAQAQSIAQEAQGDGGKNAQLQQQIEQLKAQLADKSAELELKARDLELKEEKIGIDARLAAEKLSLDHVNKALSQRTI
ncbi:MAG: phage portal protein [Nitrosospira sp.]|nr:phage portal protein [Nitrosospira sp.]MDN5881533.1 phage portal protein [Nitrosospira sp.]